MTSKEEIEETKIYAETPSVNRKKAVPLLPIDVMIRVEKQDGVGLTPAEVWCLYFYIERLQLLCEE